MLKSLKPYIQAQQPGQCLPIKGLYTQYTSRRTPRGIVSHWTWLTSGPSSLQSKGALPRHGHRMFWRPPHRVWWRRPCISLEHEGGQHRREGWKHLQPTSSVGKRLWCQHMSYRQRMNCLEMNASWSWTLRSRSKTRQSAVKGIDDSAKDEEAAEAELAEEPVLYFEAPVAEGDKTRAVDWLAFRFVTASLRFQITFVSYGPEAVKMRMLVLLALGGCVYLKPQRS
eukprot:3144635-Amphidinium_carterae.1